MIQVENCSIFSGDQTLIHSVSFHVEAGSFFGLIGESGGGKTLITKAIMGLLPQNLCMEGKILLAQKKLDLIVQDPLGSLQLTIKIGRQLDHLLKSKGQLSKSTRLKLITDSLNWVGFTEPKEILAKFPYQLSGGMCQKVAIAAALLSNPEILIADEPTSALDEESQKNILDLLRQIQTEKKMTILLVTHDLSILEEYTTHIGVVYNGRLIEFGLKDNVLKNPKNEYTKELIGSFETK